MWKRHQLVVGAVGIFLLVGSIVISTAGVSGATTGEPGVAAAATRDRDHGRHDRHDRGRHDRHDRGRHDRHDRGRHDQRKKCKCKGHNDYENHKCKPHQTTTVPPTTVPEETTTVPEETTTIPEETTTVPEETTTVPEETTTTAEVGGVTTIRPDVQAEQEEQPEVLGITQTPEAMPSELAFTGVSNAGIAAAGAGLLLIGLALVSAGSRRRQEA